MCVPFLTGPGPLQAPASPCLGDCPLFRAQSKCGSVHSIAQMSYLALCRGSPATGDAIPGLRLKVLSTIVAGRSGDSRDGDEALGRSKAHGRRDQKQVRALTWKKGHSPWWGMWESDGEGHRWKARTTAGPAAWAGDSHCLPGFQKLCCSTVSSSYFSKRASSWKAPTLAKGECPEPLRVPSRLSGPVQVCVHPWARF